MVGGRDLRGGPDVTLPLTKDLLRGAYDFLRMTPPFKKWKLPPGEIVKFVVTRSPTVQGDHILVKGVHTIRVSCKKVGATSTLMELMAHEMVHVKCDRDGVKSEHGADFKRAARLVCKYHGFDEASFV